LFWGKNETITASITEFESVSQCGVMFSLGPVNTCAGCDVQHLNNVSGFENCAKSSGNGALDEASNPHVVIVIRNAWASIDISSVWDKDELTVTVQAEVCRSSACDGGQILGNGLGLRFGEGADAHVSVRGADTAGASGVPVESEVSVGISSSAECSGVVGTCLSPQPVAISGELVAIRVEDWGNMEIESVQQTSHTIGWSVQKVVDDVSANGVGDPFSGMDIGINEDDWPLSISTGGNLDKLKGPLLEGRSVSLNRSNAGVIGSDLV